MVVKYNFQLPKLQIININKCSNADLIATGPFWYNTSMAQCFIYYY